MYRSVLLVNVGDNPDRPRPGRLWLHNSYRVHQRICMAFPSKQRIQADAHFLKPYDPSDFSAEQVHISRTPTNGFLFRIDPLPGNSVVILVQSAIYPDWDYAFANAMHLLAAPPQVVEYEINVQAGEEYVFCLLANPTRKIDTKTGPDGKKNNGRRVPVKFEKLVEWLENRSRDGGFELNRENISIETSYVYWCKDKSQGTKRFFAARYRGVLTVKEPKRFTSTLISGVGSGKSFGFGLFTIKRLMRTVANHESA